jgi:hypothetical protein
MNSGSIKLMAIEPLPERDWQEQVHSILNNQGFKCDPRRSELIAWKKTTQERGIHFTDSCSIRRLWLAPSKFALGINSRRLYFLNNGSEIDRRPERFILSNLTRPKAPSAQDVIGFQMETLDILREALKSNMDLVALERITPDIGNARIAKIGGIANASPPSRLNELYREMGFDYVPDNFTVTLCPLENLTTNIAQEFSVRLEQVAAQRQINLKVIITSPRVISDRLDEIETSGEDVKTERCVLFILPRKGNSPTVSTLSLFKKLEDRKVPFKRAYADDPLKFSIPDQFPSILMAAGGRPHRSPTKISGEAIWTVGIDLSHRVKQKASILCLTLVSPDGDLIGAWKCQQQLDETAQADTLINLLLHCRTRLLSFDPSPRVMVLRDGRMFSNEDSNLYSRELGATVSLFEFRKRGNPQIILSDMSNMVPNIPIAAMIPGEQTMFITTAPPRSQNDLPAVSKVTWHKKWNRIELTTGEVGRLLSTSATAPGLGLHARHLPAPIYWADGLAGANDEDLRFRGIPIEWVR